VTSTSALVTAVRSAKQFLTYVASGPFQYAVAFAFCKQTGVLEEAVKRLRSM